MSHVEILRGHGLTRNDDVSTQKLRLVLVVVVKC